MPPLYPNLITLKRGTQINGIIDSLNPRLPIRWGIKDSFSDLDIELIYVERDGEIVSGMATNQSGDSVGISNSFGLANDLLSCVAYIAETHPMKGIVGYGSKAEVAHLSNISFDEIGDLRVWLRG